MIILWKQVDESCDDNDDDDENEDDDHDDSLQKIALTSNMIIM